MNIELLEAIAATVLVGVVLLGAAYVVAFLVYAIYRSWPASAPQPAAEPALEPEWEPAHTKPEEPGNYITLLPLTTCQMINRATWDGELWRDPETGHPCYFQELQWLRTAA
jgi:hypothetical protein